MIGTADTPPRAPVRRPALHATPVAVQSGASERRRVGVWRTMLQCRRDDTAPPSHRRIGGSVPRPSRSAAGVAVPVPFPSLLWRSAQRDNDPAAWRWIRPKFVHPTVMHRSDLSKSPLCRPPCKTRSATQRYRPCAELRAKINWNPDEWQWATAGGGRWSDFQR
jgi:hypothetical protein